MRNLLIRIVATLLVHCLFIEPTLASYPVVTSKQSSFQNISHCTSFEQQALISSLVGAQRYSINLKAGANTVGILIIGFLSLASPLLANDGSSISSSQLSLVAILGGLVGFLGIRIYGTHFRIWAKDSLFFFKKLTNRLPTSVGFQNFQFLKEVQSMLAQHGFKTNRIGISYLEIRNRHGQRISIELRSYGTEFRISGFAEKNSTPVRLTLPEFSRGFEQPRDLKVYGVGIPAAGQRIQFLVDDISRKHLEAAIPVIEAQRESAVSFPFELISIKDKSMIDRLKEKVMRNEPDVVNKVIAPETGSPSGIEFIQIPDSVLMDATNRILADPDVQMLSPKVELLNRDSKNTGVIVSMGETSDNQAAIRFEICRVRTHGISYFELYLQLLDENRQQILPTVKDKGPLIELVVQALAQTRSVLQTRITMLSETTKRIPSLGQYFPPSAQRPLLSNAMLIDRAAAWAKTFPEGEFRIFAQFILDHIHHISQEEFEGALRESVRRFNTNVGRPYVLILEKGKSTEWAYALAREFNLRPPTAIVDANEADQIQRVLKENVDVVDLVVVDDASYSGIHIQSLFDRVRVNVLDNRQFILHTVVPFITKTARNVISDPNNLDVPPAQFEYYHVEIMPTIEELIAAANTPNLDLSTLKKFGPNILGQPSPDNTLTYFEHKIPDHVSFPEFVEKGYTVISGQFAGPVIRFIPETKAPYRSDYLKWIAQQQTIGRQPEKREGKGVIRIIAKRKSTDSRSTRERDERIDVTNTSNSSSKVRSDNQAVRIRDWDETPSRFSIVLQIKQMVSGLVNRFGIVSADHFAEVLADQYGYQKLLNHLFEKIVPGIGKYLGKWEPETKMLIEKDLRVEKSLLDQSRLPNANEQINVNTAVDLVEKFRKRMHNLYGFNFPLPSRTRVRFIDREKLQEIQGADAGFYSPLFDTVFIGSGGDIHLSDNQEIEVIVHELVHKLMELRLIGLNYTEGLTQYFAERILDQGGFSHAVELYPDQVEGAKQIVAGIGERNALRLLMRDESLLQELGIGEYGFLFFQATSPLWEKALAIFELALPSPLFDALFAQTIYHHLIHSAFPDAIKWVPSHELPYFNDALQKAEEVLKQLQAKTDALLRDAQSSYHHLGTAA